MSETPQPTVMQTRVAAIVILVLTLLYLCLELPFSVDLLNGVGGVATTAQLQRLEISGRLISGLALALLVWGFVIIPWGLRRGWRWVGMALACVLVTFPVVFGVYYGERALVDKLAQQGGSAARQTAFATVLLTQGIKRHEVNIRGLALTDATRKQPDAKAFMALLPLMTGEMVDLRTRLMPVAESIVRNRIITTTGGKSGFYERTYVPALKPVKAAYNRYRQGIQSYNDAYRKYHKGVARYRHAVASADTLADKKYWQYRKYLARKTHSKGPAPAWECPRIRRLVNRKYGIKVPNNWNCWARAPFSAAVAARIRKQATRRLHAAERKIASARPKHVITSFAAFVKQNKVQKKLLAGWENSLAFDVPDKAASAHQTVASWNQLVYQPLVEARAHDIVTHFIGHVSDFDPDGPYYERGLAARKLLLIPAIALFFSLLGALTHIVKTIVVASEVVYPQRALRLRLGLLIAGLLLIVSPFWISTSITRSPVFTSMEQSMQAAPSGQSRTTGSAGAAFARWTIQTEAILYPPNARLRDAVDRLYDFENSWLVRVIAKHSKPLASPLDRHS